MNKETTHSESRDPVEYLLQTEKYHDWTVIVKDPHWTVIVKDPHSDNQKIFGVLSYNLAAHSSVFRTMMSDPKWVKESKLEISNMSPETFNLLYRFVNGGDLPQMSREDAADLALAADMYMMPRLVKKGCKRLVPTKVDEVFPALIVVSFISSTSLEPHVVKFVQVKTKEIMTSDKFLPLDVRCVEFIVKQAKLSCAEVEVWKCLVKWAKHQVAGDEKKMLRSELGCTLKYVRFRTLTHEEIVREVAPTNILTAEELSSLLCAVIGKQPWNQPGLCDSQTVRLPSNESTKPVTPANTSDTVHIFKILGSCRPTPGEQFRPNILENKSYFTIEPEKNIELKSLVFKPKPLTELGGAQFYSMKCTITVNYQVDDLSYGVYGYMTSSSKKVFGGDNVMKVSPLLKTGYPLKLNANQKYHFTVELTPAHKTFEIWHSNFNVTSQRTVQNVMVVKFTSSIHVQEMHYKILP